MNHSNKIRDGFKGTTQNQTERHFISFYLNPSDTRNSEEKFLVIQEVYQELKLKRLKILYITPGDGYFML